MVHNSQFKQVDVFVQSEPFKGNPVAVFFSASHLDDTQMQCIANWTNLSETSFVLPENPNPHTYRLRIFTPSTELPFAGHPTIGSAHAVIEAGLVKPDEHGKVYQECKAGLIELNVTDDGVISFKLPYYRHTVYDLESDSVKEIASAFGVALSEIKKAVLVEAGPVWFTLQFSSGELVRKLHYNSGELMEIFKKFGLTGVSLFGKFDTDEEIVEESLTYEGRNMFIINGAVIEDSGCGSGIGGDGSILAEYEGFEGDFIVRQGRSISRDAVLRVKVVKKEEAGNDIFVGGKCITIIDGKY